MVSRIQVRARTISAPPTASALKFHRAYFQRPKLQKGGYLYTPQIKFGRILNNSRFDRLCTVFLHRRHSAFLQIAPISRRTGRYQKLSIPPLPLFARSANYTRFLRLIFFRHKLAVLQSCTHFCIFHLFAKISTFLRTAILRAFLAFFIFAPIFQKQEFFRAPKIRLYFNRTKRGGIFHFKPPKQRLKLKFIFLKSTQNLWKGFWENLTMCHILPHFAGKQCAFFN